MSKQTEKKETTEYDAAVEAFESMLAATLSATDGAMAIDAFREIVAMTRTVARKPEGARFKAIIRYGEKTATFGPTTGRDAAASLARAWMESHAGVTSRGEPVTGVEIVEVPE